MAVLERNGNLNIWWFPKEFSQSRYGEYHHSGTNSCTLITLILADMVAKEGRGFYCQRMQDLPPRAVEIFAEGINKGNSAYAHLITANAGVPESGGVAQQMTANQNLNIPDALNVLKRQPHFRLKEWFFTHMQADPERESCRTIALRLLQAVNTGLQQFRQAGKANEHFLFAAMISDNRTVLFVIEFPANLITFFDSHQHGRDAGAVVAQCNIRDMYDMMNWFVNMNHDVYSSQPHIYEVSFLLPDPTGLPTPSKVEKCEVTQLKNNMSLAKKMQKK
ncbi:uncharacterized protein LOC126762117 [Bactrocera neohumeralis]|uniref:uncharacterized protein LOC120776777 n=1 Tax=Bactrocera tryoni TaxID=59916 RepID=UPI001A98E0B5|nr:uncharacterized protein LOC120776777 [Bactrocera tryoni]XP_050334598.1 uncharacterized protein LOC126762117 [Bactrocera neohumeralis]